MPKTFTSVINQCGVRLTNLRARIRQVDTQEERQELQGMIKDTKNKRIRYWSKRKKAKR